MRFLNFLEKNKVEQEELKSRVDKSEAIRKMQKTEGWKILEQHMTEQLHILVADNATEATDWDNYQKKAGKIFGIKMLFINVEDFIRQGEEASEQLDKLKD